MVRHVEYVDKMRVGSRVYTECEILQRINKLKMRNTELRKQNQHMKNELARAREGRDKWRDRYNSLVERVKNLTIGLC